jgi:hypothetical protein
MLSLSILPLILQQLHILYFNQTLVKIKRKRNIVGICNKKIYKKKEGKAKEMAINKIVKNIPTRIK